MLHRRRDNKLRTATTGENNARPIVHIPPSDNIGIRERIPTSETEGSSLARSVQRAWPDWFLMMRAGNAIFGRPARLVIAPCAAVATAADAGTQVRAAEQLIASMPHRPEHSPFLCQAYTSLYTKSTFKRAAVAGTRAHDPEGGASAPGADTILRIRATQFTCAA